MGVSGRTRELVLAGKPLSGGPVAQREKVARFGRIALPTGLNDPFDVGSVY